MSDIPATDEMIMTVGKNAFSLIGLRINRGTPGVLSLNVGEGTAVHCGVDLKDDGNLGMQSHVMPALTVLRGQVVRTALSA